ncbi:MULTISPECIES: YgfZ/GcvT domain-containing protein [Luteimonas]|uniref:CAF17-like 4Fe-4S cluster assembly/insertion protein YgfZ n=1 Tax=Luteimonas TaxID=83614 RepID=UPI000C7DA75C|nr:MULTISPECIES: folate-binding protein YgfZ [Luteimonas]
MSDKLEFRSDACFALPDLHYVRIEGADASAFVQAQVTSDVAALPDGHWHWSAWLTPKGRVIAIFALLRVSATRLDLVLLDVEPAAFVAQLQRYVFRSKVTLTRPGMRLVGALQAPESAVGSRWAAIGDAIELDVGTASIPRTLRIAPGADHARDDPEALARWRRTDLALGLPRLAEEQQSQWTPQQLSLDRLRAYSVSKGCYPGQEIVARTHFLGQAKRGLQVLQASDAVDPELDDVLAADTVIGKRIASAGDLHLAVMPPDAASHSPLTTGGRTVQPIPMRDGLAR